MPKLIENVLIGGRVCLAGENVSEADAKSVRPEVFVAEQPTSENSGEASADEATGGEDTGEAPAKPSGGRGKRTSTK